MVYAKTKISSRERNAKISLGFWDRDGSHNPGQKTRPSDNVKNRKFTVFLISPSRRNTERISKKTKGVSTTGEVAKELNM